MAEIQCVCGRRIPVPEAPDGSYLRCPACDAHHAVVPSGRLRIILLILGLAAVPGAIALALLVGRGDEGRKPDAGRRASALELFEEARGLLERGKDREAAEKCKEAIAADPKAYEPRIWLARLYQGFGYHEDALAHLEAARQMSGDKPVEDEAALGEALLEIGERHRAIQVLEAAWRRKASYRIAVPLADAYYNVGRFRDAETLYRRILRENSKNVAVLSRLTLTLLLQGEIGKAEAAVKEGLAALSDGARSRAAAFLESSLLRFQGKLPEALARIESETERAKVGEVAWRSLTRRRIQALFELGRWAEAVRGADALLAESRGPRQILFRSDAAFIKIMALLLDGKRAEALAAAKELVPSLDPRVSSIRPTREAFLFLLGERGVEEFARTMKSLPPLARNDYFLFLAACAKAQGDRKAYRALLDKARRATIRRNYPYFLIEELTRRLSR